MRLLPLPQLRQTHTYDCGATALQSILFYYGIDIRLDTLIKKLGTTAKTGTHLTQILKMIHHFKLKYDARSMTISDLKTYINTSIPILIPLQAWSNKKNPNWKHIWKDGHYVVAIGYTTDTIIFEDPASFKRVFLTLNELEQRWHDRDTQKNVYNHFGIAIFGKKPETRSQIIHMD